MSGASEARINYAEAVGGRRAMIVWRGAGAAATVDLSVLLANDRRLVRVRRDEALFATLRAGEDGSGVVWADGSALAAAAIRGQPDAAMSNGEFRGGMDALGYTLDGLALRLGLSRRLIADYRASKPVPPSVAFAMRYLLAQGGGG